LQGLRNLVLTRIQRQGSVPPPAGRFDDRRDEQRAQESGTQYDPRCIRRDAADERPPGLHRKQPMTGTGSKRLIAHIARQRKMAGRAGEDLRRLHGGCAIEDNVEFGEG
jgi:hypothetical protein